MVRFWHQPVFIHLKPVSPGLQAFWFAYDKNKNKDLDLLKNPSKNKKYSPKGALIRPKIKNHLKQTQEEFHRCSQFFCGLLPLQALQLFLQGLSSPQRSADFFAAWKLGFGEEFLGCLESWDFWSSYCSIFLLLLPLVAVVVAAVVVVVGGCTMLHMFNEGRTPWQSATRYLPGNSECERLDHFIRAVGPSLLSSSKPATRLKYHAARFLVASSTNDFSDTYFASLKAYL